MLKVARHSFSVSLSKTHAVCCVKSGKFVLPVWFPAGLLVGQVMFKVSMTAAAAVGVAAHDKSAIEMYQNLPVHSEDFSCLASVAMESHTCGGY